MEVMNDILNLLDPIVMALILLAGIFTKNFLTFWKWDTALKTLIVSTGAVIVYIGIKYATGKFDTSELENYFLTYFFTTSLYEILLKSFFDKIGINPDGDDEPE